MQFHRQCDYLFRFQAKRISKSILLRRWSRNNFDIEDDAYETLVLAYNRKLDLPILTSSITRSNVEQESSPPYLKDVVTYSKEEITNLKDINLTATP